MKEMLEKPNGIAAMDKHMSNLLQDIKDARYNLFIGEKFGRDESVSKEEFRIAVRNKILDEILFSETAKDKLVRYLSFQIFVDLNTVINANPFFDVSLDEMRDIVRQVLDTNFLGIVDEYKLYLSPYKWAFNQCQTPAHFVQMLAKAGKQYHMAVLPDEKKTPEFKKAIVTCAMSLHSVFISATNNDYAEILLGRYASFTMPESADGVTLEFAYSLFNYIMAKFMRFYFVYIKLSYSDTIDKKEYEYLFNYPGTMDYRSLMIQLKKVDVIYLVTTYQKLVDFIIHNGSLSSLLQTLELLKMYSDKD